MIKVPNYNVLTHLPGRCEEGELAFLTEENKVYEYVNGSWQPQKGKGEFKMSLYELNKDIVTQLPGLSTVDIETKCKEILTHFINSTSKYFMLLGHEIRYYTLFVTNTQEGNNIVIDLIECLCNLGQVKSIELTQDNTAMEIWVTDQNNSSFCMYFFNYDAGVIECQ